MTTQIRALDLDTVSHWETARFHAEHEARIDQAA